MKTKNLILTTMMILFTIGMTGCDKDNDRLFDGNEPIEETKEPEEVDLERKYQLSKDEYYKKVTNDVVYLVNRQNELYNNDPTFDPVLADFFRNSNDLRGFVYRSYGKKGLKKFEELITFLLDALREGEPGHSFFTVVYQETNTKGFYIHRIEFSKPNLENNRRIDDMVSIELQKYINNEHGGTMSGWECRMNGVPLDYDLE